VIITLLDLPLDLTPESPAWTGDQDKTLLTGVPEYVKRCKSVLLFELMVFYY
jgi:protein farnesyltransferase subunit beta